MASLLGKPLMLVNADAALLMSEQGAAAGGRPRRLRLRRRGRGAHQARPWSPATRCAPRSRRCPRRPSAMPARSGPLQLLVVGGSLGAKVLNDTLPAALRADAAAPAPAASPTRPARAHRRRARRPMREAGVEAEVLPFIDDMAGAAGGLRPDRLPRRRGHGQRAVRRRRARHPGAADRQHHRAPARQRRVHGPARRGDPPAAARADAAGRWPALLRGPDAPGAAADGREGARPGEAARRGARGRRDRKRWCARGRA